MRPVTHFRGLLKRGGNGSFHNLGGAVWQR